MGEHKLEPIRIVTRCTTREQFVVAYRKFCTPTSCFIPSSDHRPIGTGAAFSIRLADGETLLRGEGVILEAWTTKDNPFKRAGILLGIHRLDDDCSALFEDLLLPPSSAIKLPPGNQLQMLLAQAPNPSAELETPTIEMPPLALPPLALPEEPRVPGSSFILPANPLTEMTDDLLDAFIESTVTSASQPTPEAESLPIAAPPPTLVVVSVAAVPEFALPDKTVKTVSRDLVATLLGMVPLQAPRVYAAPLLVSTEGIDRVQITTERVVAHERPALALVRHWWLPATVAATLLAVVATALLVQ